MVGWDFEALQERKSTLGMPFPTERSYVGVATPEALELSGPTKTHPRRGANAYNAEPNAQPARSDPRRKPL